ncbi:MAG: hypothetical protein AAF704_03480 [Cyanobacteria bacterium P01_D01_bin.123]
MSLPNNQTSGWAASLEVHIVPRADLFYRRGRTLAQEVYNEVWGTDALIDGNQYGAIVTCGGIPIGNVNIQTKRDESDLLKSENLYGCNHWHPEIRDCAEAIAEISGLAISVDVPQHLRRPAMMMLILGLQMLSRSLDIRHYVTIQRDSLIRVLTSSLQLPFRRNERIVTPVAETPSDRYWCDGQVPRLYYLELASSQAIDACASFFCYLSAAGWQMAFYPRINSSLNTASFSKFRRSWQDESDLQAVARA